MGKPQPIKDALGLGEVIKFSDGTQFNCVPASLADLEDAMKHWDKTLGSNLSIQGIYHPDNQEAKVAFEELLFIACGRNIPKEELRSKINVANGGLEVMQFLRRFLGLEFTDASSAG